MATYDVTSETTTKDFSSILKDGDIINNGYSGYARSIILPPGIYRFECWGAQGGNATYSSAKGTGGKGCHVSGEITLEDAILYLYTGGKGNNGTGSTRAGDGGWNGGGSCGTNYMGGSGGGATDIRTGGTSLTNRVIIAGGGGGGACFYNSTVGALSADGGGGGQNGENGEIDYAGRMSGFTSAQGGTQSAGGNGAYYAGVSAPSGSLGNGGNCYSEGGGAGGGGYYGGGGGAYYNVASARKGVAAGAGGSSYANKSFANVVYNSGTRSGDGYITITAIKILKGFAAYYKTSNSWKQISKAFVKVNGSWKSIKKMYYKQNGSWKEIS